MKFLKLEKIVKEPNPIIRATIRTFFGKIIVRDIIQFYKSDSSWKYADDDSTVYECSTITVFNENNEDVWYVNGYNEPKYVNNINQWSLVQHMRMNQ